MSRLSLLAFVCFSLIQLCFALDYYKVLVCNDLYLYVAFGMLIHNE